MKKIFRRFLLVICCLGPVAVWGVVKPIRILAPELNGVTCLTESVCIDDVSQSEKAQTLYKKSVSYVNNNISFLENKPRVVFCSTESCFQSFGFNRSYANAIGSFGIVLSPRAWDERYLRHEMIHHLQKEKLGNLKGWFVTPEWFMEGMAYSLSKDPREKLASPWQEYRVQFDEWFEAVGKEQLWIEANKL